MIDVHAPHEATHTWKDFFIHIATIVVGLLIAIGLEQTVEAVHRHIERRDVVESLMTEADTNLDATARDFEGLAQRRRWSDEAVAIMLHAKPGGPLVLPFCPAPDMEVGAKVAWQSALQSGQVNLLDRTLRTRFSVAYSFYDNSLAIPDGSLARVVQTDYRLDSIIKTARRPDGSFDLTSADDDQRKRVMDLLIEEDALLLSSMRQMMYLDAFSTAISKAGREDDKTYFAVFDHRLDELQQKYPEMHVSLYTESGGQ